MQVNEYTPEQLAKLGVKTFTNKEIHPRFIASIEAVLGFKVIPEDNTQLITYQSYWMNNLVRNGVMGKYRIWPELPANPEISPVTVEVQDWFYWMDELEEKRASKS